MRCPCPLSGGKWQWARARVASFLLRCWHRISWPSHSTFRSFSVLFPHQIIAVKRRQTKSRHSFLLSLVIILLFFEDGAIISRFDDSAKLADDESIRGHVLVMPSMYPLCVRSMEHPACTKKREIETSDMKLSPLLICECITETTTVSFILSVLQGFGTAMMMTGVKFKSSEIFNGYINKKRAVPADFSFKKFSFCFVCFFKKQH